MGFVKFAEDTFDFVRCQLPDGTYYGSRGECVSGREVAPRKTGIEEHRAKWQAYVAARKKDPAMAKDENLENKNKKLQNATSQSEIQQILSQPTSNSIKQKQQSPLKSDPDVTKNSNKGDRGSIQNDTKKSDKKPKKQYTNKNRPPAYTKSDFPLREGLRQVSSNRPQIDGADLTKQESDWLNKTREYLGFGKGKPQDRIDTFNSKVRDEWMTMGISSGVKKHLRQIMKEVSQIKR